MDIEYKGANAVVITTKKLTIVSDPKLSSVGLKDIPLKGAVSIATHSLTLPGEARLKIAGPGEYEVADTTIKGVPALFHTDHDDIKRATMYSVDTGDFRVAILGHVAAALSEQQIEELGIIDILVIPVGGGGYTLDSLEAAALVRQISPKIVVPTHYEDAAIQYEVPQVGLEGFLQALGASSHEKVAKLKLKPGTLPEALTVIEIERSN